MCFLRNLTPPLRPIFFSEQPALPAELHRKIVQENYATFDTFLSFPKPLIVAVNGPAIGASVTSATLSDAIVASEKATFSTPFAKLSKA